MQLVSAWLRGDPTREGWIWTLPEKEEHAAPATTMPDATAVVVEASSRHGGRQANLTQQSPQKALHRDEM